jgi:hypothetical protein
VSSRRQQIRLSLVDDVCCWLYVLLDRSVETMVRVGQIVVVGTYQLDLVLGGFA